jgi:2',3'-cyclic-nucleotide 2'-phosphodiesterase (5'-nucleotidase family)
VATITLLHTNDLHGSLTRENLAFLLQLREGADLYFDTGDCIKAGNLAVPIKPDPAWGLLAEARCDASVPGNRESHPLATGKKAKFAGCKHPVVCANWRDRRGRRVFPPSVTLTTNGLKVAVLGVMVPMVTPGMATQAASQYVWEPPLPSAVTVAAQVRQEADLVVALTHIGVANDRKLAQATGDIDIILGGHSHTVLQAPDIVDGTPICQGGSHGRFVGRYVIEPGKGLRRAELLPWP